MRGRWMATMCALALALMLLAVPQVLDRGLLFDGAQGYTFYLRSASSQAEIVTAEPSAALAEKLAAHSLAGESARYDRASDAFAQAEKYGAALLFTQKTQDVTDYYYYTPRLDGGVWLDGERVNLHIALRGEGACIGSPLIFGGY